MKKRRRRETHVCKNTDARLDSIRCSFYICSGVISIFLSVGVGGEGSLTWDCKRGRASSSPSPPPWRTGSTRPCLPCPYIHTRLRVHLVFLRSLRCSSLSAARRIAGAERKRDADYAYRINARGGWGVAGNPNTGPKRLIWLKRNNTCIIIVAVMSFSLIHFGKINYV